MKIKKIIAAVAATAIAVSAMAINAFAADSYKATIGFADTAWAAQDWETSVDVTGDGTYTLTTDLAAGAVDFGVFVVDLVDMYANAPDATAVLDKVTIDGTDIDFDASKIIYGDIEEKGNYRIEIYNQYGLTKDAPPVDNNTAVASTIAVTFTVSGLGGSAPADTTDTADAPATDSTTESAGTGNAAAMTIVSVMAIAGIAAVATKKRK